MESVDGKETIRFELQISDCDVLDILKLIKECVSNENVEGINNEIQNDLQEDTKNQTNNPLDRAKKLGFTYLYPTKSRKSFC